MLRSDDGGESWVKTNEDHNIAIRPFYYTEIAADPKNADRVYNIFTQLSVSIDGGRSFALNPLVVCCAPSNTIHIDNHAFWINPNDPKHLVLGNDGGIAISRDRGETWRFVRNLPLSQFYHIRVDQDHPYHIYGGLQDNGSWRGPSEVWENAGIRNLHWQELGFGDGFDTLPDPDNSRRGYVMSQGGMLSTWNLDTGEERLIRPASPSPDIELRFNWNAGLAQDLFDSATIYFGSQFLHKSTNRGATWTVISGDLTSNDPARQTFKESGGLTFDVTAAENYTTIVSVAPSPLEQGTIWVGTDDGRVHVTRDGGESWKRIDGGAKGVHQGAWVPMITPSPHDAGSAFVVFDDHRRSDMKPYVYRVEAYGSKWKSLVTDELSGYALSVLQDPVDPELLFLGTEFGLFISVDGGDSWTRFTAGVPTVSVMDMAIQERENDLVLGTHGRSIYVLDDYSALRGLQESHFDQRLKILSATPGQQYDPGQTPSTRFTGSGEFRAENEAYGVVLTFMASGDDLPHPDKDTERERSIRQRALATDAGKEDQNSEEDKGGKDKPPKVEMTIRDANGELIRQQKFRVHQGINRLAWGLEHDGIRPMPGPEPHELDDGLPGGPEVPPGQYQLTLSLDSGDSGSAEASIDVTVLADPRSTVTAENRHKNYATRLVLQELAKSAVAAVERIQQSRTDVETTQNLISARNNGSDTEVLKALGEAAVEVKKGLDELEKRFRVPPKTKGHVYNDDKVVNRIAMAQYYAGSTWDAPTDTALVYIAQARVTLNDALEALNRFMNEDVAAFGDAVNNAGIGLFSPAPPL